MIPRRTGREWSSGSGSVGYIGPARLCDERGLMVDPLKLFWVITNSTYLGTSDSESSLVRNAILSLREGEGGGGKREARHTRHDFAFVRRVPVVGAERSVAKVATVTEA